MLCTNYLLFIFHVLLVGIKTVIVSFSWSSLTPRPRSEERRVGKSVDLGGRRIIKKKTTKKTNKTKTQKTKTKKHNNYKTYMMTR